MMKRGSHNHIRSRHATWERPSATATELRKCSLICALNRTAVRQTLHVREENLVIYEDVSLFLERIWEVLRTLECCGADDVKLRHRTLLS